MSDHGKSESLSPSPPPVMLQPESGVVKAADSNGTSPPKTAATAAESGDKKGVVVLDPIEFSYQVVSPWRHVAGPAELEQIAGQLKKPGKDGEEDSTLSPARSRPAPPSVTSPRMSHPHDGNGSQENSTSTSPLRERATSPAMLRRADSKENVVRSPSSGDGSPRKRQQEKDAKVRIEYFLCPRSFSNFFCVDTLSRKKVRSSAVSR